MKQTRTHSISYVAGMNAKHIATIITDLGEFVKNPANKKKADMLLFFPYNFKNNVDEFITREKKNAIEMTYLVFDIDSDSKNNLKKVVKDLKDYEYYLYFSKSATKENPKFRVILPLDKPIPMKYFENHSIWAMYMKKYFPYHDQGAARRFGGYYLPNRGEIYKYKINKNENTKIIDIRDHFIKFHDKTLRKIKILEKSKQIRFNEKNKNKNGKQKITVEAIKRFPSYKKFASAIDVGMGGNAASYAVFKAAYINGMENGDEVYEHLMMIGRMNKWSRKQLEYQAKSALNKAYYTCKIKPRQDLAKKKSLGQL
jgi:hypothetical protein